MNHHRIPFTLCLFAVVVFAAGLFLPWAEAANPDEPGWMKRLADFDYKDHHVYKTVTEANDQEQALEFIFFKPAIQKHEKPPLVIYIHGGAWSRGDRHVILWPGSVKVLRHLVDSGIAVASIQYRLTRTGVSTAYDCVVDGKDAARYFTLHADKFGIDPERIATWGGSAGGHLALMTALAPDESFPGSPELAKAQPRFRAACAWFPATSFIHPEALQGSNFENPQRFVPMLGGSFEDNKDLARLLSPTEHLHADTIPVLLVHGDQDRVLPVRASQFMVEEARRAGAARVELVTVENADHGFRGENAKPSLEQVAKITADFLIQQLTEGL